MGKTPRLEVLLYIPINRKDEERKVIALVNFGARELDEDELLLFSSCAEEVTDKSFRTYRKFSDKADIEAKGDVDKDPMVRVVCYKSIESLIEYKIAEG